MRMQVSVQKKEQDLQYELTIELPSEDIELAIEKQLRTLSQTLKIPGFRVGKVPLKVVKARYEKEVCHDVCRDYLTHRIQKIYQDQQLNVAGQIKIDSDFDPSTHRYVYKIDIEVFPEIPPVTLADTTLERTIITIDDDDLTAVTQKLYDQYHLWESVARTAQKNDRVTIDFTLQLHNKQHQKEEHTFENVTAVLGSNTSEWLPGIEQQLLGKQQHDTFDLTVQLPKKYKNHKFAQKKALCTVTVKAVAEQRTITTDAELAQAMYLETTEAMRTSVRSTMEREARRYEREMMRSQVYDALLTKYQSVQIPITLINEEVRTLTKYHNILSQFTESQWNALTHQFFNKIKIRLLLQQAQTVHGVTIDSDTILARIEELALDYENDEAFRTHSIANQAEWDKIEHRLEEEALINILFHEATSEEKQMSFTELTKSQQAAPSNDSDDEHEEGLATTTEEGDPASLSTSTP
jgi:trigger factor